VPPPAAAGVEYATPVWAALLNQTIFGALRAVLANIELKFAVVAGQVLLNAEPVNGTAVLPALQTGVHVLITTWIGVPVGL
jgi:hypothetical protein